MGYTSQDDLINKITSSGKFLVRDGLTKNTTPAHTAGGWHLLNGLLGHPNQQTFPGTDLLYQSCWETTGDGTVVAGIQHGGNVTPDTKHAITVAGHIVAAVGAPWVLKLVDLQGYYRLSTTNVTGTGLRTLINTNTFTASSSSGLLLTYTNDFNTLTKVRFTTTTTLPTGLSLATDYWLVRVSATTARVATSLSNAIAGTVIAYTDAGSGTHAVGSEAFFVAQTLPTGGGPNLSASSYTNSGGTNGRAFSGSPTMGATADAYACRVLHSGNAAGRYGAFLPKQAGDVGISSIESFTWSGGSAYTGTGVVALCIARPLGVDIPVSVSGQLTERDLVNQIPSLPKIDEGACLSWMLFGTGATSNNTPITTSIGFGWA
jgi:hypothetical protein